MDNIAIAGAPQPGQDHLLTTEAPGESFDDRPFAAARDLATGGALADDFVDLLTLPGDAVVVAGESS